MRADGHEVLVTGGTRGIGLALARCFRKAGNRVMITGRDTDRLQELEAAEGFEAIAADLADRGQREHLISIIKSEMPGLNVLVNNAGIQVQDDVGGDRAMAEFQTELTVNALAPVHLAAELLPLLSASDEAAIVNVTSVLAIQPKQSAPVYCASKAFLASFSRSLRYQLEGSPVRVFEIVPPMVETAMTAGRGSGKISPEQLADEFWRAWRGDRFRVLIGKAKLLALVNRISPWVAARMVRNG